MMRNSVARFRTIVAAVAVAALVAHESPASASGGGIAGFEGPIGAWLGAAPAGCVVSQHFFIRSGNRDELAADRVSYWIGSAMKNDSDAFLRDDIGGIEDGPFPDGRPNVSARYDARHRSSQFSFEDKSAPYGMFADQSAPPTGVPVKAADLSALSLGGNVHLYDSLATVTRSLGLHALAPTPVSACPGLGVVEVCGWNARGCACPPIQQEWFRLEVHRDGIIIFDNARVIGLVWDKKC